MDEWSEALGGCAADQTAGHNYTSIAGVYNHGRGHKGLGLMVLRLFSEVTSDDLLLTSGRLQPPKLYICLLSSQVMYKTAQAFRISTCRYM
jgi:hypothetical protein